MAQIEAALVSPCTVAPKRMMAPAPRKTYSGDNLGCDSSRVSAPRADMDGDKHQKGRPGTDKYMGTKAGGGGAPLPFRTDYASGDKTENEANGNDRKGQFPG